MKKESFEPYIHSKKNIAEFTLKAIFIGIVFSFIFAIGNAYLALKSGATVSASIPAAILSIATLKLFFKRSTILEHNMIQTIATVGEGLAAGVIFTIPALLLIGEELSIWKVFVLTSLGGILGILFMIPMRRYIIVKEHGVLPFPEGTACSEILKAKETKKASAISAFWSFLIASIYKISSNVFFIFGEFFHIKIPFLKNTKFSVDGTPALLGVGYIVGFRITSMLFAGGILSWFIIIPLIKTFGGSGLIIYPSTVPVNSMSADEIWSNYVRYIGAGAVAGGGIFSLIKIIPMLYKSIHGGVKKIFSNIKVEKERTDKDISMHWLVMGSIAIILTLWILPITSLNFFTIILLITLGFFFVAVTSITVGIVGSSSNPTSGMTITTLLITSLLFTFLGWTEKIYLVSAISLSCVVNVAICMAGTTSQDLKTGYLLGATPRHQQVGEIIGIIIPSIALGFTIIILNKAYTIGSPQMPAPQASLMAMIAKGVISKQLPFILVGVGFIFSMVLWLLRLPILAVAIGLYLPLSLSSAIMIGGIVSKIIHKKSEKSLRIKEKAILIASGMIGGDAITGVLIALLAITGVLAQRESILPSYFSLIAFVALALYFLFYVLKKDKTKE
jgi:putative OPT family oligopeptide transporter